MPRLTRWVVLIALLLSALWGGLWLLTWRLAHNQLAAFAARMGPDFRYQELPAPAGSLTTVILELTDVALRTPAGLQMTAPRLTLALTPGHWRHYALSSAAPVRLNLALPAGGALQLTAQNLQASLDLHDTRRWAGFEATLQQATLARLPDGSVLPKTLLQTTQLFVRGAQPAAPVAAGETGFNLTLAAQEATLPPGLLRVLPQTVTAVTLNARLLGTPPDWRQKSQVTAWRAAGGTMELESADFSWGRLSGRLEATLALDKNLQPEGAGTAQLFLDTTTGKGDHDSNTMLKNIFGLFAKTDAQGTRSVTLPLALQERELVLGIFPLTTMPEIVWRAE